MEPRITYRIVKDQLLDEGNARENLATFCQTYMEPNATKIMAETMDKNAIDKSEYPRTAELENRCVNIIANLWHAQPAENYMGTSTVGSSEACMLGGLAGTGQEAGPGHSRPQAKPGYFFRLPSLLGKICHLL